MKDIILLDEPVDINARARKNDTQRARTVELETELTRVLDINAAVASEILETPVGDDKVPDISNGAPNIALNVRNSTASPIELWIWAIAGTVLQCSALIFPAVTTYYLGWKKGSYAVAAYGYPCFAIGTFAVVVGMILCGRVIEGSTTEHDFKLRNPQSARIMRLQRACTVSDQHFSSYAIFNSPNETRIRTSRRNNKSYR